MLLGKDLELGRGGPQVGGASPSAGNLDKLGGEEAVTNSG